MRKELYQISTFILIGIYFITLWTMDVSVGAMLTPNAEMFGLWGLEKDSNLKYHQALYLNIIVFFILIASLLLYKKQEVGK